MRAFAALGVLLAGTSPPGAAQDTFMTGLRGRVIADGRPVNFVVEVRLDSETLGKTLATAYTLGSEEFEFQTLPVNPRDSYFLIIDHDGYEPVRYPIDGRDFWQDPRDRSRLGFTGVVVLYLVPESPDPVLDEEAGPRAVDIRQLTADIPEEARDAYAAAVEDIEEGEVESGLRQLERAIEIAPDFYDALNALGVEYLKNARYSEAETVLERAHQINRNDPRPLVNLGMLHFEEGQAFASGGDTQRSDMSFGKAVGVLEEAVRLDPLVPESSFYLGSALYQTGDYARAESLLFRALEMDSSLHDVHLTLLNVYTRQQRWAEALGQITAYLEAVPASPRRETLESVKAQIEEVLDR